MSGADDIRANVDTVLGRIETALARAGRKAGEVSLLAVTKMHQTEDIEALLECGVKLIGENRVQEAESKYGFLKGKCEFHMIGHLQTNKADKAAKMFDVVQSVDSVRLAEKLSGEAAKLGKTLTVFSQVNSSGEGSKSGFEPEEFVEGTLRIAELDSLKLRGVMTIGPLTDDEVEIRKALALTRGMFEKIRSQRPEVETLSMGMTDDLEIAIEEGSTMVRVGRALFERR